MDDKQFEKLMKQARSDEAFFHNLVFYPEKAAREIDFLSEDALAAIAKVDPESVLRDIITGGGLAAECEVTVHCTYTCGHTSSLQEQLDIAVGRAAACGHTVECTYTCGHTSSLLDKLGAFGQQVQASIERRAAR
jgi:hypothetical protein